MKAEKKTEKERGLLKDFFQVHELIIIICFPTYFLKLSKD